MATALEEDLSTLTVCGACFCRLDSCYCKFPQCIGQLHKTHLLCLEGFYSCGLIHPCSEGICAGHSQCLCLDQRCAFPCSNSVPCSCTLLPFCLCFPKCMCCPTINDLVPNESRRLNVDPAHLTICSAFCCCIQSLYCKFPDCFGCSMWKICLGCCRDECYFKIGSAFTCFKQVGHCFCLDTRCAIPCDQDVPIACTILPCLVIFPCDKVGCCKTIGDLGYSPPPYSSYTVQSYQNIPDNQQLDQHFLPQQDQQVAVINAQPTTTIF